MQEDRIVFDDAQIKELAAAFKRPAGPTWSTDRILQLVQALAIILGGCWVVFQFLAFERESLVAEGERQALRTQELKHSVELKHLEAQRTAQGVQYANRQGFKSVTDLQAKLIEHSVDGMNLYEVSYALEIENISGKVFEISAWVLDYHLGELPASLARSNSKPDVARLGHPASRWSPGSADPDGLAWRLVGTYSAILPLATGQITDPWESVIEQADPVRGGVFVGYVNPGESQSYDETFLVRAKKGTYMVMTANLCFDRAATDTGLYARGDSVRLTGAARDETAAANKSVQATP
jgi:hypothetical protein